MLCSVLTVVLIFGDNLNKFKFHFSFSSQAFASFIMPVSTNVKRSEASKPEVPSKVLVPGDRKFLKIKILSPFGAGSKIFSWPLQKGRARTSLGDFEVDAAEIIGIIR